MVCAFYIHPNIWINKSALKNKKKDLRKDKSLYNSIKNLTSKSLKHWPWLLPGEKTKSCYFLHYTITVFSTCTNDIFKMRKSWYFKWLKCEEKLANTTSFSALSRELCVAKNITMKDLFIRSWDDGVSGLKYIWAKFWLAANDWQANEGQSWERSAF